MPERRRQIRNLPVAVRRHPFRAASQNRAVCIWQADKVRSMHAPGMLCRHQCCKPVTLSEAPVTIIVAIISARTAGSSRRSRWRLPQVSYSGRLGSNPLRS